MYITGGKFPNGPETKVKMFDYNKYLLNKQNRWIALGLIAVIALKKIFKD